MKEFFMNIKLVYGTKTSHSRKLAENIARELNIEAQNIANCPHCENVDLLFLAGGIYGGESLPQMLEYVKLIDETQVKNAALITSCVSKKMYQESVRRALLDKGIQVVDEFVCQGSFLFFGLGHPNKKDIDSAVAFARTTIEKLSS